MSIVEMAEEEAGKRGAARVNAVHLKLGPLSGVVPQALLASYDLACADTLLEGSARVIEDVPIVIDCPVCRAERSVRSMQSMSCVVCGAPAAGVVHGREIEVVALELSA
jgi:hydrogenase nickel incorporation protein HypA/HybF